MVELKRGGYFTIVTICRVYVLTGVSVCNQALECLDKRIDPIKILVNTARGQEAGLS